METLDRQRRKTDGVTRPPQRLRNPAAVNSGRQRLPPISSHSRPIRSASVSAEPSTAANSSHVNQLRTASATASISVTPDTPP